MKLEILGHETLLEVVRHFADERTAWDCFVSRRWPYGVACIHCGGTEKIHLIESRLRFRCNHCGEQFSATTGTVFEASHIKFSKWIPAMWLVTNSKNGVSSYELARNLKVTQKTAWFMLRRIKLAIQNGTFEKPAGRIESIEALSQNTQEAVPESPSTGSGGKGNSGVASVFARPETVPLKVAEARTSEVLGWLVSGYRVQPTQWSKTMNSPEHIPNHLIERKQKLKALWAKSDDAIAKGMPVLTVDQINAEVSDLRGNDRGDL